MRDAVKAFKANQTLVGLLPSKPRRIRPKTSDASSSDTESETLFLDNIARRSEAILLLREVPSHDTLATLHYPPLSKAPFTHIFNIPQAPAVELQAKLNVANAALAPDTETPPFPVAESTANMETRKVRCMSWEKNSSCKHGKLCRFVHLEAARLNEFQGEGKKDIPCIKFGESRCHRGAHCVYRHDLRDSLVTQLQQLKLPTDTSASPTTFAKRIQAASPGRGAVQLEAFLEALNRTVASSLLEPIQIMQLTTLASLATCAPNTLAPQLTIQPAPPLLTILKRLSLEQQPILACEPSLNAPIASRFTRSSLTGTVNIGELNGFCLRGHKLFKRTPIRISEMRKCTFCKTQHRSDVFTCAQGCSHSCLSCLNHHSTARAPPQCMAHLCSGSCTIEPLSKPSTCWNGGHPLNKGVGVWHCNICKFLICRDCAASSALAQPSPLSLQPSLDGHTESSSAFSANASAPILP
jgi:hypothetical protein